MCIYRINPAHISTMDIDSSSIRDTYRPMMGTGSFVPTVVNDFAYKWVAGHYLIAFAIIIVLVIVVIWLTMLKGKEGFNPTQNLRDQDSDQFGLGAKKERLDGDRSTSVFATQVQSGGGGKFTVDPNATANQPGSIAWQVLHSSDFNCANRVPIADDAWGWMSGVAKENLSAGKPKTDNEFSKVLAGQ